MTQHQADALLKEWQDNRNLPKEVRLEEDYDFLLQTIDFAMNTPDDLQPAQQ